MKAHGILLLLFSTLIAVSSAQNPTSSPVAPGVSVIKFTWSKERVGWERDPFGGVVESYDEMRARTRNEKRIDDAKRGGNTGEADRLRRDARADAAIFESQRRKAPPRYFFLYKASVRNDGAKIIKTIDWDYVFLKPARSGRLVADNSPVKKRSARARAKS